MIITFAGHSSVSFREKVKETVKEQIKNGRKPILGGGSFKEIYGKLCRDDHWSSASKCINILRNKYSKKYMGRLIWGVISLNEPAPFVMLYNTVVKILQCA